MVEITLKGYYDLLNEWIRYTRVVGANGQEATIDYGLILSVRKQLQRDDRRNKVSCIR